MQHVWVDWVIILVFAKMVLKESIVNIALVLIILSLIVISDHFLIMLLMTDVNECVGGRNNCSDIATCLNNDGSFTCTCPPGYDGDGTFCTGTKEEEKKKEEAKLIDKRIKINNRNK